MTNPLLLDRSDAILAAYKLSRDLYAPGTGRDCRPEIEQRLSRD